MSLYPKQDDPGLPSYNEAVAGGRSSPVRTIIHDELLNLSVQFSCIQGQKVAQLARADEQALNLILPHVKDFLTEYSETTLPSATLILVPAGIVSPIAMPADNDLRKADDFGRVVMVSSKKSGEGLIWNGEAMSERLAGHLRPRALEIPEQIIEPYPVEVKAAQTTPLQSRSFWRRKPGVAGGQAAVPSRETEKAPQPLPKVAMEVKADEIVFRTENEMGLYETVRVWGILVRVCVGGVTMARGW